jgi:hypothetical protein
LYFSDGNNEVLDSLFDDGLLRIEAAKINEEGLVADPAVLRNFDTYLDETEVDMLQQVQRLLLYVRINTSQQDVDYVKLYPDYRIDLHLALRAELEMNLNDL